MTRNHLKTEVEPTAETLWFNIYMMDMDEVRKKKTHNLLE